MNRVELTVRRVVRLVLVGVLDIALVCALALILASFVSGHGAPIGVNLVPAPSIYTPGMHASAQQD